MWAHYIVASPNISLGMDAKISGFLFKYFAHPFPPSVEVEPLRPDSNF
jgi:hypothetical protein